MVSVPSFMIASRLLAPIGVASSARGVGEGGTSRVAVGQGGAALRLLTNRFLGLYFYLLSVRLFPPVNAKEAPTVYPPDGPLERLHSPERRAHFAMYEVNWLSTMDGQITQRGIQRAASLLRELCQSLTKDESSAKA